MKILVTNLKTSPDRREHMMKQFEGKGLDFSFVDCVIGKDLTLEELNTKCDMKKINYFNREVEWFTKGVIGCTLTNQNTYRSMIANNDQMALLLEDDILLPDNFKDILTDIESKAVQGDVILLFFLTYNTVKLKLVDTKSTGRASFYIPLNPEQLHGGSAMVVTLEAAKKMLEYNTPVKMPPDSWRDFYEAGCINRLICIYPQPVDTADFGTTMGYVKDGPAKKIAHSNSLTRFLLKLKRKFHKRSKKKVEVVN